MGAKRFFYIAAGLFLLVAAYTMGASRVQGQVPGSRLVAVTDFQTGLGPVALVAVTENGDWYYQLAYAPDNNAVWPSTHWVRGGNIGIGPISVNATTWSTTKGTYRK